MPKHTRARPGQTVLIVEDSLDFASLLKFLVEDDGFEGVVFPVDETDIVGWAVKHTPAVIMMDLALRRKEGTEFIDLLKADAATKSIPIIVLTGRDLGTREIQELEFKAIKYLRKGRVELDEIRDEVCKAAAKQRRTAQVAEQKK